jgi:hypothetical protein
MNVTTLEAGKGSIEVKRFYVPIQVELTCPTCKGDIWKDFEDEYLSYPLLGEAEYTSIFCEGCDDHLEFKVQLDLTLKVDTESVRVQGG